MILSMSRQAAVFLSTIMLGAVIGFIYDLFRVIRKIFHHPGFIIQLEDILYWILVLLLMFYYMLNNNAGEIRAFSIAGALLGMALYFFTVSRLFMKASDVIIGFMKKVIAAAIKIITTPIKWLLKILQKPVEKCCRSIQKGEKAVKRVLHISRRYVKMKKHKAAGEFKIIFKKI